MGELYYRLDGPEGTAYTAVETDDLDDITLPDGAVRVTKDQYQQAMDRMARAEEQAEAEAEEIADRSAAEVEQAQQQVMERLAELGLPVDALNTLVPGLNLPAPDVGTGEGE